MRKHDVRKWLHAILDLLPVILIPVFMIYSHRHTIDSGSIEIPQNEVVDFNQQLVNGDFNTLDSWNTYYANATLINNNAVVVSTSNNDGTFYTNNVTYEVGNIYQLNIVANTNNYDLRVGIDVLDSGSPYYQIFGNLTVNNRNKYSLQFSPSYNSSLVCKLGLRLYANVDDEITYYSISLFNLTQMFGEGNEPTQQQFNDWYTDDYYAYTISHKELLKNTSTITYNDTDIMSQFTYQLYNSVDKYFNMGNVFHLGEVYDWFTLNIFNGNAPIYIYVVYQIVLYELIMDLLFLLYALFMWFIDMIEKLMEKPLNSVR